VARLLVTVTVQSAGAGETEIRKRIAAQADSVDELRDSRGRIVSAVANVAREVIDLALQDYIDVVSMAQLAEAKLVPNEDTAQDEDTEQEQS